MAKHIKTVKRDNERGAAKQIKRSLIPELQTCRLCGCTERDCTRCVQKTGEACYWVAKDLCSACYPPVPESDAESVVLPSQASRFAIQMLEVCRILGANEALLAVISLYGKDYDQRQMLQMLDDWIHQFKHAPRRPEYPAESPVVRMSQLLQEIAEDKNVSVEMRLGAIKQVIEVNAGRKIAI